MPRPDVSVLMPAWNTGPYIGEAIESVLSQKGPSLELVILDDGSRDGTLAIARAFRRQDPRVRVYRHLKNRGLGPSRTRLARLARGRYAVVQDSDDIMLPGRLQKQHVFLESHPGVGLVFGDALVLDPARHPAFSQVVPEPWVIENRFLMPHVSHCTCMVRTELLRRAGRYRRDLPICEDLDMLVRLSEMTRFCYLPGPAYMYRIRPRSTCRRFKGRMDPIHEAVLHSALRRRGSAIRQFTWALPGASLSVRTNSTRVCEALRATLRRCPADRSALWYHLEVYEVEHVAGLYSFADMQPSGYGTHGGNPQVLYWKYDRYGLMGKLDYRRRKAILCITPAGLSNVSNLMELAVLYPLIALTRRHGWHFFHSAAAANGEGGILILGPSGAGKTTSALHLAARGYRILSDETNIVRENGRSFVLTAFPRALQLKAVTLPQLARIRPQAAPLLETEPDKFLLPPDAFAEEPHRAPARLKGVVLLRYEEGAPFDRRPLTESGFFSRSARDPVDYSRFGCDASYERRYRRFVRKLLGSAPSFHIRYGRPDLPRLIEAMESLLTPGRG